MSEADPQFSVVRGTPTAEELAALVGVLFARSRPAAAPTPAPRLSPWVRAARPGAGGALVRPGADGWRASALPR
ncbi:MULTISPECIES: acyl-CoA carboxylase subunit epsilon [Polymorphospora]|uniref:Acyl-CoA carboxylase subunit epsilon n=1 Tax=Polymorphospora lycopeni TaxID=3140240 RepID=A0ABV5CJW7_9ACTN